MAESTDDTSPDDGRIGMQGAHDSPFGVNTFVYAIGQVEARFPSLGVEKELAQAIGRKGTPGLTDREALYKVLSVPENLYIARRLCWVLTIEGVETYLLYARDTEDTRQLLGAIRPRPGNADVDVVIGARGEVGEWRLLQWPDSSSGSL